MSLPLVSVILPIRNEIQSISRCLHAIFVQDYPFDRVEILIADGISTDGTRELIKRFAAADSRIQLVDNHAIIMASGFNAALLLARGDVIVIVGGHTELSPNYLSRSVAYLREHRVDCVGGYLKTIASTSIGHTIALAMSSPFGVGGVAFRTEIDVLREVDTVAFGAYRREIVDRAGPLDEELIRNQDDEYNYRLRKMGARILQVPDIYARYHSRASLRALWRQYFQYGLWKVRVLQKHPLQMRPRQFVPPAFAMALCLSLLPLNSRLGWLPLAVIIGVYVVANLSVSLYSAFRHGWHHLPLLPLAFAILHLSYGFGFLFGLIKFIGRWNDKLTQTSAFSEESRQRSMPPAD